MRSRLALAILVACALLRLGYDWAYGISLSGVPPRRPLAEFPLEAAGTAWKGTAVALTEDVIRKASVSEYVNRYYLREGMTFWFYVGYYNGSTVDSIHQPEVCFPGSGYRIEGKEVVTIPGSTRSPMRFNWLQFEKQGTRRLTAYTFYYRGSYEPEEGAIYSGRAFSSRYYAVITTAVDLEPGTGEKRTAELLRELLGALLPRLEQEFFPEEAVVQSQVSVEKR